MRVRHTLTAATMMAAILAGCGGGSGDGGAAPVAGAPPPAAGAPATDGTRVPASAMATSSALIVFLKSMIAGDSETAEPRTLEAGDAGTDDTGEPGPV